MRLRLIAAGVVLAIAVTGCGGGGPSTRDEVARYIEGVNAIQEKAKGPSRLVSDAARVLSKPKGDRAAAEQKLTRAAARLDALRVKVAAVEAPEEALRLRSLLLEVMRGEAAIARELERFVAFEPAFRAALVPLGPAGVSLKDALAAKSSVDTKAAAFDAYAAVLTGALRRLRALDPPPASEPQYTTQLRTLEQVHAATIALAKALRARRAQELPILLNRFQRAAVGNQSLSAQRAQIAALRAYNGRVHRLDELRRMLAVERARLERTVD